VPDFNNVNCALLAIGAAAVRERESGNALGEGLSFAVLRSFGKLSWLSLRA
jgi:hypothetical protein